MSPPSSTVEAPEGIVVGLRPGWATVRVDQRFVCPRCAAGRGCGAGIFGRGGSGLVEVSLPPEVSLTLGQSVSLSLEPGRLLHAAWLVYGIPLLALFSAALVAGYAMPGGTSDAVALAMAAAGLLCGGWWARRRLRRVGCAGRFVPYLAGSARRPSAPGDG